MFGGSRRHKAPPQPLTRETANPNAATAAASAFMRRDTQSPSLSSAAAAAALRARPTTPTNVSEVQSKRVGRRSASVSSSVGRGRRASRPELQRAPSNSSMTERTFRTPSPSPGPGPVRRREEVPPVPTLPKDEQTQARAPSHKKTLSLQTQPFRTASQKMRDGDGGSWFGSATTHDPSNVRTSDAVMQQQAYLDDRSGSISPSVNFSYPRGFIESPNGTQRRASLSSDNTLVYDANSRRMVPQGELAARQHAVDQRQQAIQEASERPVRKKKQEVSRSGSHLAKGTMGRTKSIRDDNPQVAPPPAAVTPEPKPAEDHAEAAPPVPAFTKQDHQIPDYDEEQPTPIEPEKVAVDELEIRHQQGLPTGAEARQKEQMSPSTEDDDVRRERQATLDTLSRPREEPVIVAPAAQSSGRLESPAPRKRESVSVSPAPLGSKQQGSIRRSRVHSESPARTARFATAADQLVVKHEPPPRSLSPRKSALKHSSPRPLSPSDDSSEASGPRSTIAKDDPASRKKSARVSFNDKDTVVVGEAASPQPPGSPVIPSPQVKKSWTSLIGRHKKDTVALDEDETMTPRPALPAFGSVREKKPRETDERPLVRPTERAWSPPAHAGSPIGTAISPEEPEEDDEPGLGQSNDHAVGAILAQDSASRNEANTSKYREPLPPVVTSMDHSGGYISNSPMSSDNEEEAETQPESQRESQEFTQAAEDFTPETTQELEPARTEPVVTVPTSNGKGLEDRDDAVLPDDDFQEAVTERPKESVPVISVSTPTPTAKDEEKSKHKEYFGVPGGFPEDDTSESSPHDFATPLHESPSSLPSAATSKVSRVKPAPITPVKAHEVEPGTPSPQMDKIQEEQEGTEESEVFSDAYEDLSEMEGDGFLSLDAVLTTPVKTKMSQKVFEQAQKKKAKPESANAAAVPLEPVSPKTADEWEQAKSYWKSLTADKRRQLELEAMEEAGEEADQEDSQKPKKAKKRRSMDKAIADPQRHPDRTYQIQPGTKWSESDAEEQKAKDALARQSSGIRKSMRGEAPVAPETARSQGGSMRKSLRSGDDSSVTAKNATRQTAHDDSGAANAGGLSMRKSMRAKEGGASLRQNGQAGRPVSYNPSTSTEHVKLHKRMPSYDEQPSAAATSSGMKSSLRRRGSDTSESSFTRVRPGTAGAGGGFAFRSTMRNSMREPQRQQAPAETVRSSRFSLRSLSPTPFRRASATSPPPPSIGNRMKPSMRSGDSSDGGSTSRLRLFGRSGGGKKPDKPGKDSRFGDSSDEEDARPAFSSRFADSSDEDDGRSARPVSRGMSKTMRSTKTVPAVPRGPIRSDSPDLPDSDDEQLVQPKRNAPSRQVSSLHRSGSGRGSLASPVAAASTPADHSNTLTPRPSHQRRGSFMSNILRRKKDPSSKISRDTGESAARRDTELERSTEQLAVMRSNSGGRLQKKGGPSWPLPDDEDVNNRRPATAGATSASGTPVRPGVLQRRTMSGQIGTTGMDGAADSPLGTPKKKKFGALRKMFGLHN